MLVVGEASGDVHGAHLVQALLEREPDLRIYGVAGELLEQTRFEVLFTVAKLTGMGLVELVGNATDLWRAYRLLRRTLRERKPSLLILIDFPDFNLRLAKHLKRAGVPVLYFVAPQVWAWRPRRLKTIRRTVTRLLCIFPFEEGFFRNAGVAAKFVGHPLVGRVRPSLTAEQFRSRFSLPTDRTLIALLPGSRQKEILLNLPPMLAAAGLLAAKRKCSFVLPVASTTRADWVRQQTALAGVPVTVVENSTYDAVAHSQAAIVASGTAATETALLGTPMVIVYRVSGMSWLLGRWLVHTPFYSMVNLVEGREVVPELIQNRFQPETVAREIEQLLDVPQIRQQMQDDLADFAQRLQKVTHTDEKPGENGGPVREQISDPIQRSAAIAESILKGRAANQS